MKLAYLDMPSASLSAKTIEGWSGTPFYMSKALQNQGMEVDFFFLSTPPDDDLDKSFRYYANEITDLLRDRSPQVLLAPFFGPLSYLNCELPSVVWTDSFISCLYGFYPEIGFAPDMVNCERQALARARLVVFASEWAARTATEFFGISQDKVKVVPFGANIDCSNQLSDIQAMVKQRPRDKVKLLFIGKNWQRKKGDIVLKVAKDLNAQGYPVELTLVGSKPPPGEILPPYVKSIGYISKFTVEGREKLKQLLQQSHFLFVPSRAEAFGIVFCEASAYGVPSLTSWVGGIPTVVKDNINGMKFPLDAPAAMYCDYIINLMSHYSQYESLALSSFHEYETRLNWDVAAGTVKQLITEIL